MFKKLIALVILSLAVFTQTPPSFAREVSYLAKVSGLSLLRPDYPPPPGGAKAYEHTDAGELHWSIAQWSNPGGALPKFKKLSEGQTTIFETIGDCSRVKLEMMPNNSRLVLEQDGHLLPCSTVKGSPREWDLFLQPNGPGAKPPMACGLPLLQSGNPPLSELKSLMLEADVTASSGLASTRKNCKCNFANTNMSLVVTNTVHPGQTIFYQYVMSRLCGTKPDIRLLPCTTTHNHTDIFAQTNPLNVNDYPPVHGQSWLEQGRRTHVNVDVLPTLEHALAENQANMDKNLAHWSVRTFYCGQAIYGDTKVKSVWENVALTGNVRK